MKLLFTILTIILSLNAYATDVVDIYGTDEKQAKLILKQYTSQVQAVEDALMKVFIESSDGTVRNPEQLNALLQKKAQLVKSIKHTGNFASVDLQTVNYPDDTDIYTTIEVVRRDQLERLHYIPPQRHIKSASKQQDIIQAMSTFQMIAMDLMIKHKLDPHDASCPVYHCLAPFKHPKLKPYLAIFNKGATEQKSLILNTLDHDPNPERRTAAAYLVAHFQNPNEIMSILSKHVNDEDDGVRNSVLRVFGETAYRTKIKEFDATPFLTLLDSPFLTDRNKALLVLFTAAESEKGREQIIKHGQQSLLALLALKQPNNHMLAYAILKKISGRDYGEKQPDEWNKWFNKIHHA
jgi:hypothetical protein